jgi:dihydrofolate synthase/folylpolyglutamate synthase
MDYEQSLQFIHSHRRFGQQRGLARIAHLLGLMSDPQDGLRFIHVAGTNGKGSVSTALQCAFTACGRKDRAVYFAVCFGFSRADKHRRGNDT